MSKTKMSLVMAVTVAVFIATASPTPTLAESLIPADAPLKGVWSAPFTPVGANRRVVGVHSIMLNTGKVLVIGALRPTVAYVYDPVTETALETDPPVDLECGGVTPLEDGRILVIGGHGKGATGIVENTLFDPRDNKWYPQPISPKGRYYPTTTRLLDGRVLITGGFNVSGTANLDVELYTPPPTGSSPETMGRLDRVGQHFSGLYPHQWVLPGGNVLELARRTSILNTSDADPTKWTWTELAKPISKHYSGDGGVLLPGTPAGSTTAALIGGGTATIGVKAVDAFDAATSTWTSLAPLPQPRSHMSPVLLPDGTILGVGGNSKGNFDLPQYTALNYRPGASSWSTLAPQVKRRGYHSSAVLLPDGRVFSAGDTGVGGGGNAVEIFSPPYLFQGSRPEILSAPSEVARGENFTIDTPDVDSRAVLMSPGASTHTVDMSDRHVELAVVSTTSAASITVMAPAMTGWYMLFLVDPATGAPSLSKWVHIKN